MSNTRIPLIYIAGPFRAPTGWGVAENIRRAEQFGYQVALIGGMPVIPHANTANFNGELTDEFWLEGTLALAEACRAMVMIPGWRNSSGARNELAHFKLWGREHQIYYLDECDDARLVHESPEHSKLARMINDFRTS